MSVETTSLDANGGEERLPAAQESAKQVESTGEATPIVGESLSTNFDYKKDYPSLARLLWCCRKYFLLFESARDRSTIPFCCK